MAAPDTNPLTPSCYMENEEIKTIPATPEVAPAPIAEPAPSADSRDRLDAARQFAEEQYDRLRRATASQMENVRDYTEEARRHLNEGWDEARRQLNEGWDVTRAKAKDLHHAGEEYVRANPSGSMLGALGVGVIIGLLLGGRRH